MEQQYIRLEEAEFSNIFKFLEIYAKTWQLAAMIHEYSWREGITRTGSYHIPFDEAWQKAEAITGYWNFNGSIKELMKPNINKFDWNDKLAWAKDYLENHVVEK